jgi:hypothetical protein
LTNGQQQHDRHPGNHSKDTQSSYQQIENKERKHHLPPRFQRANDEKERYYNSNQQSYQYPRRPQKFNENRYSNQQQSSQQEAYNKDDFAYDLNANKVSEPVKSPSTAAPVHKQVANDEACSKQTRQQSSEKPNSKKTYNNQYQSGDYYDHESYSFQKRKQYSQNQNDGYYAQHHQKGHTNAAPYGSDQIAATNTTKTATNNATLLSTQQQQLSAASAPAYINIPGIPMAPVFYSPDGQAQAHPYYNAQAQYDPYFCPVITTLPFATHPTSAIHIQPPPAHAHVITTISSGQTSSSSIPIAQQQNEHSNTTKNTEQQSAAKTTTQINDSNNNISNTSDKNNTNKNAQVIQHQIK